MFWAEEVLSGCKGPETAVCPEVEGLRRPVWRCGCSR